MDVSDWIAAYARALGLPPPTREETAAILDLAGEAAHSSARTAAPLACWLAARADRSPADALELARTIAAAPAAGE